MKSDDIDKTKLGLKQLPDMEPPIELVEDIMSKVSQPQKGWFRLGLDFLLTPYPITFRPATLVLTSCLIVVLGYFAANIDSGDLGLEDKLHGRYALPPNAQNAEASFLMGRGLMAAGLTKQALPLLQKATIEAPDNPEYAMWAGFCFAANGRNAEERSSYLKAIESASASPTLLLNIGHSYLEERNYEDALTYYNKVLSLESTEKKALYNKALIFHLQGKRSVEQAAWKTYLDHYSYGVNGFRAVQHLNNLDDFTYRIYQIGRLKIILNQSELLSSKPQNTGMYNEGQLFRYLHHNPSLHLDIVTYDAKSARSAREKAINIKQYFVMKLGLALKDRIRLSWFGVPEKIETDAGIKELPESVLIFARNSTQLEQETSI